MHRYDYTLTRARCEDLNLHFDEAVIVQIEPAFAKLGFDQETVDEVLRLHMYAVSQIFDTKRFSFSDRVKVAIHFLLGRSLTKNQGTTHEPDTPTTST